MDLLYTSNTLSNESLNADLSPDNPKNPVILASLTMGITAPDVLSFCRSKLMAFLDLTARLTARRISLL
jgi:hypothetical protein